MLDDIKYANALTEILHYFKGIKQEDIDKIPKKFMNFIKENAAKNYKCQFDYTKPLNQLELQEETKGLIAMICLNYWCDTEEEKRKLMNHLNKNELEYQEQLKEKYDIERIFNERKAENKKQVYMIEYKRNIFQRILDKIKRALKL